MTCPDYGLENNTTLLTPWRFFLLPWTPWIRSNRAGQIELINQGMMACIHLHDYVLTVEAKYLQVFRQSWTFSISPSSITSSQPSCSCCLPQMFLIFHIYTDNIEGVVDQFEMFNRWSEGWKLHHSGVDKAPRKWLRCTTNLGVLRQENHFQASFLVYK